MGSGRTQSAADRFSRIRPSRRSVQSKRCTGGRQQPPVGPDRLRPSQTRPQGANAAARFPDSGPLERQRQPSATGQIPGDPAEPANSTRRNESGEADPPGQPIGPIGRLASGRRLRCAAAGPGCGGLLGEHDGPSNPSQPVPVSLGERLAFRPGVAAVDAGRSGRGLRTGPGERIGPAAARFDRHGTADRRPARQDDRDRVVHQPDADAPSGLRSDARSDVLAVRHPAGQLRPRSVTRLVPRPDAGPTAARRPDRSAAVPQPDGSEARPAQLALRGGPVPAAGPGCLPAVLRAAAAEADLRRPGPPVAVPEGLSARGAAAVRLPELPLRLARQPADRGGADHRRPPRAVRRRHDRGRGRPGVRLRYVRLRAGQQQRRTGHAGAAGPLRRLRGVGLGV